MEELIIPNPSKNDVAGYNILINGKDTDPTYELKSLSILREENRVPTAIIVFVDGDAAKRSFKISNKNDLIPGNKIQIYLGRDSKNKQAFKGIIVKHTVKVKANGFSELLIECMDEYEKMTKIRGRAKFIGFGEIKPGDTVKITGVGDRFNGKAYVAAVRQEMGSGTWETQIQFGLDPAPIPEKDANDEKGFTTRSKMHISFNDKTNTITIDTPSGNSIKLDEKGKNIVIVDQSNNKITMQPSGISLESPKNIDIKAGAVLTLSGGTSLSVGAPSVSVKADADVSISGATAKLAGQGPTEITGLPVKIN